LNTSAACAPQASAAMPNAIAVFFIIKNSIKINKSYADVQRNGAECREKLANFCELPCEDCVTLQLAHIHANFIWLPTRCNKHAACNQG
jgi:hypothetical protein